MTNLVSGLSETAVDDGEPDVETRGGGTGGGRLTIYSNVARCAARIAGVWP